MRHLLLLLATVFAVLAQTDSLQRAEQVLQWRTAEETPADVPSGSSQPALSAILSRSQGRTIVYRVSRPLQNQQAWMEAIATAAKLKSELFVGAPPPEFLDNLAKAALDHNIVIALDSGAGVYVDPEKALSAVQKYDRKVRVWGDVGAWERSATRPLAAVYMLREYLAGATLSSGQASDDLVREAHRLDIRPLIWTVPVAEIDRFANIVEPLVAQRANRSGPGRRQAGITPEERAKIEAALPSAAPVAPKRARKLLVFDLNVGRGGHPSIPYANLAMQLIGEKTGAFEATVTSDPAMLNPARLKEFDAVYLNNTIGDIFSTKEARDGFVAYMTNGGGLMGNHATTVTATDWPEFANILGARGASHRMQDEKVIINVEEPNHPIVRAFGAAPFEYIDEIFRVQEPFSREKLRVLLSVDPVRSDMNQGRCFGQCYRDDNDYAVAWVKQYGKGRVFYTTLGHNSNVFWDPKMLQMFLAGAQYVLGDLNVDARPRTPVSELDSVLSDLTKYDFGQDESAVRRLDRAMGMVGPSPEAAREAEQKLLGALQTGLKPGAVDAICRHLATVGSDASLPALTRLLANDQAADMARYALERIDSPETATALRGALSTTQDPRTRAGIIHSLARRRDAASVPELQKLMTSSEASTAAAAINALGMIGTPEAELALFAPKMTADLYAALLTLAEQAPKDRANAIYSKLNSASNPDEVRVAAIHGLARNGALEAVRTALQDASPNVRTAAIVNLARIEPASLTPAIERLEPAHQIQALNALVARREGNARSLALTAAKNNDGAVRSAALQALAEVGSAEDISVLVAAAAGDNPAEQTAARLALTRLPGNEIDAAIVSATPAASPKARIELIRAVGERGAVFAQDMLIASAHDKDPAIRKESLRSLRGIAQPEKTPELLNLLLTTSEDDRTETGRALAAAIGRSPRPDIKPVAEALEKTQDDSIRASLVSVLALTGQGDAVPILQKALGASDLEVQRAAVVGLSEWTSPEPMEDLLRVARSSSDPSIKVLALRGFIRLVQRPAGRSAAETAKLLGSAMAIASRADEKKAVLAAVQRVVSPESLKIAQSAGNDPDVAAEANLAASTLEKALSARGR
jgi:HEAT repeat protein/type 1 glutamine amidotransferase